MQPDPLSDTTGRWRVAAAAIVIQMCLGAIYAWSVFTPGLKDAGWSKVETQIVFGIGLGMFALVMVFAGRKLGTWGPQRLAQAGGLVLGAGYVIAGLSGGTSFVGVLQGTARPRRARVRPPPPEAPVPAPRHLHRPAWLQESSP